MKLEMKNIAPYLPYGLKGFKNYGFPPQAIRNLMGLSFNKRLSFRVNFYKQTEDLIKFTPILRRLEKEAMKPCYGYSNFEFFKEDIKNQTISYKIMNELMEQKYDVFDLIKNNSAIQEHREYHGNN